ncbi:MAG: hypothetical protein IK136_03320 [Oscillospiraceae bacterium]|nr:hypothetical protein [Oscillospiraceae bacterium]
MVRTASFLHNIVPVDVMFWVFFFFVPGIASLVAQVLLCLKAKKRAVKFIPFYAAAFLLLLVLLYRFTGALGFLIGGFVALMLLGTVVCIVIGSGIAWFSYLSVRGAVKKDR